MRRAISSVMALLGGIILAAPAVAEVSIVVDKTTQRMTVSINGQQRYSWPVSTGTADYSTLVGTFTPSRLAKVHYSREWDNAPMPHAIFFTDAGHAIHGSRAMSHLGTPASHGCVRLAPRHASILFDLVMVEGPGNTRVEITGMDPIGTGLASGNGAGGDYSRLTSFDPLTVGIMAGGSVRRSRSEISRHPCGGWPLNKKAAMPSRCHTPDRQGPVRRAPAEDPLGHDPSPYPLGTQLPNSSP